MDICSRFDNTLVNSEPLCSTPVLTCAHPVDVYQWDVDDVNVVTWRALVVGTAGCVWRCWRLLDCARFSGPLSFRSSAHPLIFPTVCFIFILVKSDPVGVQCDFLFEHMSTLNFQSLHDTTKNCKNCNTAVSFNRLHVSLVFLRPPPKQKKWSVGKCFLWTSSHQLFVLFLYSLLPS